MKKIILIIIVILNAMSHLNAQINNTACTARRICPGQLVNGTPVLGADYGINPGLCTGGILTPNPTLFYRISITASGSFTFLIRPGTDGDANGLVEGAEIVLTDYDWAVWKNKTCATIDANTAIPESINYSGQGGITGMTTSNAGNCFNASGSPYSGAINVVTGDELMIACNFFSGGTIPPFQLSLGGATGGGGTAQFLCCDDKCYWTLDGNTIGNGQSFLGTLNNADLNIIANGTQKAIVKPDGKVGIGTNSPIQNLSVNNGLNINQADIGVPGWDGSTSLNFGGYTGEGISSVRSWNFCNPWGLDFFTAGERRMVVSHDGNVGIGTCAPSVKLEVAGQVKITGGNPGSNKVLTSDGIGLASWQTPSSTSSGDWHITGNSGTIDATNFVGTTDNVPFNVRVNNQASGRIDHLKWNTFWGYHSGKTATSSTSSTGKWNTGIGMEALSANNTGQNNTGIGSSALSSNTSGASNTAVGHLALTSNVTGSYNTATGDYSLLNNTADFNTANGFGAMAQNNTGTDNTASGYGSLNNNTTGSSNTSEGSQALVSNTTGNENTGAGANSLSNNTSGSGNTSIGKDALFNNTTGANNTALGRNTGLANTTGSCNTLIGNNANVGSSNLTNATAIGCDALVNASNSLILGNNANVGIGITNPTQKLHVHEGSIMLTGQNPSGGPMILFGDKTPPPFAHPHGNWGIEYEDGAGGLNFWRPFLSAGGFENFLLFLKDNGNIGINTNTPTHRLHVVGTNATSDPVRIQTLQTANDSSIVTTDASGVLHKRSITSLGVGSGITNSCATINNVPKVNAGNGNLACSQITDNGIGVGINNANPTERFSVVGNASISNTNTTTAALKITTPPSAGFGIFEIQAPTGDIRWNGGSDEIVVVNHNGSTNGRTEFRNNGTSLMTIKNSGKVGIGNVTTNSPCLQNAKLFVQGGIVTEELLVVKKGTACWPDYVFGKDYELKPLDELENYIANNGHLPNIPSAKDIDENGLKLGEIQSRQMEKIEELTLYILQLKKEMNEIKASINNNK